MCIDTILMRRGKVLKRLHLGIALTCLCSLLMGGISVLHGKALEKTIRYQKQEDCFMCGNEDRSLFSLYNEGIGVLNLNNLRFIRYCRRKVALVLTVQSILTEKIKQQ